MMILLVVWPKRPFPGQKRLTDDPNITIQVRRPQRQVPIWVHLRNDLAEAGWLSNGLILPGTPVSDETFWRDLFGKSVHNEGPRNGAGGRTRTDMRSEP